MRQGRRRYMNCLNEPVEGIPFVYPEGFEPDQQEVNIIDVFNKIHLGDKSYIYSVRNDIAEHSFPYAPTARFYVSEEIDGIESARIYRQAKLITKVKGSQAYTEIEVDSTETFPDSGKIQFYTTNWTGFFEYTSKTATKFLGNSQVVYTGGYNLIDYVNPVIGFTPGSVKRYVVSCGAATALHAAKILNGTGIDWLFTGYCDSFATSNGIARCMYVTDRMTSIPGAAFRYAGLSGKLNIPDSVTYVGSSALTGNSGLIGKLKIPASLKTLEALAFYHNDGITELEVNGNPDVFGEGALGIGSLNLTSIITDSDDFYVNDGILYYSKGDDKRMVNCVGTKSGMLSIPADISIIDTGCFANCRQLTGNLVLPANIRECKLGAFRSCNGFTGALIIENPDIVIQNGAFPLYLNFTALVLPVGYNSDFLSFNFSRVFSADSLNQSILNITAGTADKPKTFLIGDANKARLLASYPEAEINANARFITIQ